MGSISIFETLANTNAGAADQEQPKPEFSSKSSSQEKLFNEIKIDLLSMKYEPGEKLIESRLCEKYGASRTPIRQALFKLKSEGMIGMSGQSYCSLKVTGRTLKEVYEIRKPLEILAIGQAIENRNSDDLEKIRETFDLIEKNHQAGDQMATNAADGLFHLRIAAMAQNDWLFRVLFQIHEQVLMIRNQFFTQDLLPLAVAEHVHILNAIERGAEGVACAEIVAHLDSSVEGFLSRIEDGSLEKPLHS